MSDENPRIKIGREETISTGKFENVKLSSMVCIPIEETDISKIKQKIIELQKMVKSALDEQKKSENLMSMKEAEEYYNKKYKDV